MSPLWIVAGAVLLAVMGWAAARCVHPIRCVLCSAASGVGALGAVNLLAGVTGVSLMLGYPTAFVCVTLGAPGVVLLLVGKLLLQL